MRRLALRFLVLAAVLGSAGATGRAQEATPIPGCLAGPATPVPQFRTVNQEIATELDRLFACLAARDWGGVASFAAIPAGRTDPFASLRAMDQTGLFLISTGLVSQTMRSTGPEGASVDIAWRVGNQLRHERWTFAKRGGVWRIVEVGPGVPLFDGVIVGITGEIGTEGVTLGRSALVNPGGVEVALTVAPRVVVDDALLVVFPRDACDRAAPSPLTAVLELDSTAVTLSLDGLGDGDYALALVPTGEPVSRQSVCAAPAAVVKITS